MTITQEPTTKKYSLLPSWGFVPAGSDSALFRLARAIIGQACIDAVKDDFTGQEARRWLAGEDCRLYCDFVSLDYNVVGAWLAAGCPDWRKPHEPTGRGEQAEVMGTV
jgi:hypothetical protein